MSFRYIDMEHYERIEPFRYSSRCRIRMSA